ncbi:MAG TPA: hypothetical protein ENK85_06785 [Saprospiraceae bacterium]|nr:hypothetical protein [Saprospiraceae bacterium]
MKFSFPFFILIFWLLLGCQSENDSSSEHHQKASSPKAAHRKADLLTYVNHAQILSQVPDVQLFKDKIAGVLKQSNPIMPLPEKEISPQDLFFAQAIALQDKEFNVQHLLPETKAPLLNMVTDIRPAKANEIRKIQVAGDLVLVESYNFYYNTVRQAFIDKTSRKVVKVVSSPGKSPHLTNEMQVLSQKIAMAYPQVQTQLGLTTGAIPASYEVVVRSSKCERSRHLCSAVIVTRKGSEESLWILVDLTELKAIGYQWMPRWDERRPQLVTERSLQNEVITKNYCQDTTTIERNRWRIHYQLTNSDGIEIFDAYYNGKPVLTSAKLVDWHVSYPDKKDFGYSDAMGCPQFSSAAVVAFEPPEIEPIRNKGQEIGFSFVQDFRSPVWPKSCNYRYQNLFEFYEDGRFRVAGVNLGLGCSNNGWYRPVFRIDLADEQGQVVEAWEKGKWVRWEKENWNLQEKNASFSPEGYLFRMTNKDGSGYYLQPNNGQFGDHSRGDHAFTYVAVKHTGEGEEDMSTLGPCCHTDFEQGPERFIQPAESLTGQNIIWYVPQMKNSDKKGEQYCWVETRVIDGHEGFQTYQGVVGPMFVPFSTKNK